MVRDAPGASVPASVHGNAVVQSPALDTNVSPAGVESLTVTPVATDGPAFVTTIVYTALLPGTTVGGPVLVMPRFALCVIVSVSVFEAVVGAPNPGGFCAVTVLIRFPVALAATVPVNEKVATAFTGSE